MGFRSHPVPLYMAPPQCPFPQNVGEPKANQGSSTHKVGDVWGHFLVYFDCSLREPTVVGTKAPTIDV